MTAGRRLFLLIVIAISSYIVIGLLASALEVVSCADGWRSSSIGRSGACSHHGGIGFKAAGFLALIGSIVTTFISSRKLIVTVSDSEASWIYKNKIKDGVNGICTICRAPSIKIKLDGSYFYVCPKGYSDIRSGSSTCNYPDHVKEEMRQRIEQEAFERQEAKRAKEEEWNALPEKERNRITNARKYARKNRRSRASFKR